MLFIRVSPNRVFIFSEYWILVPLMLAIDIAIIVQVKKSRAKKANNENKKELYSQKCKQCKIFHLAMNNLLAALEIRGGEDFVKVLGNTAENYIEVAYPNCIVGKGLRYVNNHRLRQLVYSLFKSKAKNGVIFITKTALCHLVEIYGLDLPALPIPVPDFIGVSSWYTFVRKAISIMVLGIPLPMILLAQGPVAIISSVIATTFGVVSVYYTKDSGFTFIPTDLISASVDSIRRRIPDLPDVVSVDVDLEPSSRSKITMPVLAKENSPYECLLPDQMISNPRCTLRPTEVASVSSTASVAFEYDDVVNMKDVTKLSKLEFSDKYELFSGQKSEPKSRLRGMSRLRKQGKTVNFLDKFGDPKFVPDAEKWDASIPKDAPKIPTEEL